jgi:Peptidase family C25/Dockerin type I domain/Propeptide_C25
MKYIIEEIQMSGRKVLLGTIFILVSIMLAGVLSAGHTYQVQHQIEFSMSDLSFEKIFDFDLIELKDGSYSTEIGQPMLPSIEIRIALPSGMKAESARLENTEILDISGEYDVLPTQYPHNFDNTYATPAFVEPDEQIYLSDQPYPSKVVELTAQSDLAGQSIAFITLYPLQYIPSEKHLILCTSCTLIIEGNGGYEYRHELSPNISDKSRKVYNQMVQSMVENPGDVFLNASSNIKSSLTLPDEQFDHVIISNGMFEAPMQRLADWHTQKGVHDTVITTSWIYANYSGTDKEKIRDFINEANSTWGTIYVLLVGEAGHVPFEYRTYHDESTPSDQYYSDFDNDWVNEVFVGRITCGSQTSCNLFIDKLLTYEKDPPRQNFALDALLVGMDLDAFTPCESMMEQVDSYIPSNFNVTKVYDTHTTNHRTEFLNALNAGQNLVNHADHSNRTVLGAGDFNHGWAIYNSNIDALTNTDQASIVVSLGCLPNYMDYNDCIAEHFVSRNSEAAGVAFIGNTRNGLYYQGNVNSLSCDLNKKWWTALFFNDKYNLGQTLAHSKHNFSHSYDANKHCEWTCNLQGEPEMPIWTNSPDSFTVSCLEEISSVNTSVEVHVEDFTTNDPVDQAYICLWLPNDVYVTGLTNSDGDAILDVDASGEGIMSVTVTKHNYLPHEQEITVTGFLCGDASGDEAVNVSDAVYIINYIFAQGFAPEPYETGDTNCDGTVNVSDAVTIVNYIFISGNNPCDTDGDGEPDC